MFLLFIFLLFPSLSFSFFVPFLSLSSLCSPLLFFSFPIFPSFLFRYYVSFTQDIASRLTSHSRSCTIYSVRSIECRCFDNHCSMSCYSMSKVNMTIQRSNTTVSSSFWNIVRSFPLEEGV
ncbi:hypothetical protein L228DRAFT_46633 [Xylona heveae TC161]|uniref:Secreted protein n=1 Tax=Xylona heveae (strain CBS 132557 / TC161) TaxID=1328760 RepID=A0A164ZI03_XYLHT|nr:hypothetical protein L228DRAFT_46633 [Xylona heveae TC161]KZF19122.1 hypothetical protein L228DRAFT_46633 [Xylona heveae TC161]